LWRGCEWKTNANLASGCECTVRASMSVTEAVIDAWLARKSGMACTPKEAIRVCRGDRVMYSDPRTRTLQQVTVVHVGELTSSSGGGSEPASVTVKFDDGTERNTVLSNLLPLRVDV
jgi:hypothetical protein